MPFPQHPATQRQDAAQTAPGPSERFVLAGAAAAAVWVALQLAEVAGWRLPL